MSPLLEETDNNLPEFCLYSDDPVTIKKNYKHLITLFHPDKSDDNEIQQSLVDRIQKASDLSDPIENKMAKVGLLDDYRSLQSTPKENNALILKSQMTSMYDILEQMKENSIIQQLNDFSIKDSWPIRTELTLGIDTTGRLRWNRFGNALTWQYTTSGYSFYVGPSINIEFKNPLAVQSAIYNVKKEMPDAKIIYANKNYLVHTPTQVALLPIYNLNYNIPVGIKKSFNGFKVGVETTLLTPSLKCQVESSFSFATLHSFVSWKRNSYQLGLAAYKTINDRVFNCGLTLVTQMESHELEVEEPTKEDKEPTEQDEPRMVEMETTIDRKSVV